MMIRTLSMLFFLLTSLGVYFSPEMTRREILFGVIVPYGFRSSGDAMSAIRAFRIAIALQAAAGLTLLALLNVPWLILATAASPLVTGAVTIIAVARLNRRLMRFAVPLSPIRHLELTTSVERLPWFTHLGWIPIFVLLAVAAYLNTHWNTIPLHWTLRSQPGNLVERSFREIYGPLVFGGEIAVWFFAFILAIWYGSRRSEPLRRPLMIFLIMMEFLLVRIFCGISLIPLSGLIPGFSGAVRAMDIAGFPILLAIILYIFRKSKQPGTGVDPTPTECWKGGMIYYNTDDAALFVGRRDGLGMTFNFGNPWVWPLLTSLPLFIIASSFWVLR